MFRILLMLNAQLVHLKWTDSVTCSETRILKILKQNKDQNVGSNQSKVQSSVTFVSIREIKILYLVYLEFEFRFFVHYMILNRDSEFDNADCDTSILRIM